MTFIIIRKNILINPFLFSFFKQGDILPTSGGGAQVVFNDMECLKQASPKARKRSGSRDEANQAVVPTEMYPKKPRMIPSERDL